MPFQKGFVPWNKNKTKKDYSQLSNSGVKKGNIPWNKDINNRIIKNCSICNKEFKTWDKNKRYCSRKCYYEAPIWNKGLTAKTDKRVEKYISKQRGRKFSVERRERMRKTSSFYKDGRSPLWMLLKKMPEWKEWRKKIFARDNWICQKCNVKGGYLHPHHLTSFSELLADFLELYDQFSPIEDKETLLRLAIKYEPFWDVDNGMTLCEDCHRKTENYGCSSVRGGRRKT